MMAFDKESVESNWSCITNSNSIVQNHSQSSPFQSPNCNGSSSSSRLNYYSPQQPNPTTTFSPKNSVEKDTCFRCKKEGHWYKNCPDQQPSNSRPQPVLGFAESQSEGRFLCNKCGATAKRHTSKTEKNPNRDFFICLDKCGFISWVDKVEPHQIIHIQNVPICKCNAGLCRVSTESSGPNAGRKFLVCPIKKGQGACDFFRWLDDTPVTPVNGQADGGVSSPPSTLTNCDNNSPASSDLVQEGHFGDKEMVMESPVADTPHGPQNHGAVSGQSKRSKAITVELEEEEDTSSEPLRKHHKRLRHGGQKIDCSVLDFDTECLDAPREPLLKEGLQALVPRSPAEIDRNCRQLDFWRQSIEGVPGPSASYDYCSSALDSNSRENCLVTAATRRNLHFHVGDWLGRLAFSPSRGLMIPAPKPFFCCVFPSFGPIFVPEKFEGIVSSILAQNHLDSENNKISTLCSGEDSQLSSIVHWEPSRVVGSSVMRDAVSESFGHAAMELQNKLLALLESMDFHAHKSMVEEARTTFDALGQLSINFQPFRERVKEFISRASSLAELELSISNEDRSYKELVDWYNSEKKRFDDVSRDHAKAIADLEASKQRIKLLDKKAANVRDMLFQIETELSCCMVENQELESKYLEMSKAKVESEFASEEAGGALKLYQQREDDRHAAVAEFKKARILLRQ